MKFLMAVLVGVFVGNVFACDGRELRAKDTETVYESEDLKIVVVKSLYESIGCLEWGVHPSRNKNKICQKATDDKNAKYVKGSASIRTDLGSYSKIPVASVFESSKSLNEIVCLVKK